MLHEAIEEALKRIEDSLGEVREVLARKPISEESAEGIANLLQGAGDVLRDVLPQIDPGYLDKSGDGEEL